MKKIAKAVLSTFLIASAAFLLIGCGGGNEVKNTETTTTTVSKRKRADLPAFFIAPPQAEDALYAVGYAKKDNMNLALTAAADRGRQEIGRMIGVKIASMIKDFLEEAGTGTNTESSEFTQSVSKSISQNFISGSKIEQQEIYEITADGSMKYEAFVLVKVSLKDMSAKLDEVMKKNKAAYDKLKANAAFEDLNKELKSLNGKDSDLKPMEGNPEE